MSQVRLHVQELPLGCRIPADNWTNVGEYTLLDEVFYKYGFDSMFGILKSYALDFQHVGKEFAFRIDSEEKQQNLIGVPYDFDQSVTSDGQCRIQFRIKHLQDLD